MGLRDRLRKAAPGVAAALLVAALAGCGTSVPAAPAAAPPPPTAPAPPPAPATATAVLATLPVRNADPVGYQRAAFGPSWADVDRNGCDTRDDVLRRDLVGTTIDPKTHGCVVLAGTLHDPYTATDILFARGAGSSSAVQIDHVVSLGDAWRSGANRWTPAQRLIFANLPTNLLAVKGAANESKGDRRADEWLPPNRAERCRYAAIQVAVKAHPLDGVPPLSVSQPEHDTLAAVLAGCPGEPAKPAGAP
jgi:hypothetical protein